MDSRLSSLRQLLRRNNQRLDGLLDASPSREIRTVGIVGAGTMGAAIAKAVLLAGREVVLCDHDPHVLEVCRHQVDALISSEDVVSARLSKESPRPRQPIISHAPTQRLRPCSDLANLRECDLVIEAISESVDAKHALYKGLGDFLDESSLLVTNTSAIPIGELAKAAAFPARFCGMHFLAPVRPGSLVEIVPGTETSKSTISELIALSRTLEQTAVVVGDRPGFIANCMLSPYLDEGVALLAEGAAVRQIDGAAEQFGIVVGPLRILDEVGLDTALSVGRVLWQAYPDRVTPSPVTIGLFKQRRLGRKSQAGFYRYASTTPWADDGRPDPEIERIVEPWIRRRREITDQEIAERLAFALLCEALHLLQQDAADPETIELISVVGLGFPAEHGGVLRWADSIGLAEVFRRMEAYGWRESACGFPPLLIQRARAGSKVFED